MLVAWTPHEQVAGAPLDVEHAEDVAVLELAGRESLRLPVARLSPRQSAQLFAAALARYQLPSGASCQQVWDQRPEFEP